MSQSGQRVRLRAAGQLFLGLCGGIPKSCRWRSAQHCGQTSGRSLCDRAAHLAKAESAVARHDIEMQMVVM